MYLGINKITGIINKTLTISQINTHNAVFNNVFNSKPENIKSFDLGGYIYPITKQLIFNGRKNKVLNNSINFKIPMILFHGSNDKVVPLNISRKILRICKKSKSKLVIIKNGDHSLSRKSDLMKICNELNNFINISKFN